MLDKINTKDNDILDLIEILKVNKIFNTSFLRDRRIYSYPFLYSQLDSEERKKLDITDSCNAYCIVYDQKEDSDYYILDAYTFIDEISLFDFESIIYNVDCDSIIIEKKKLPKFSHDTNGISSVINGGMTIKIPKKYKGDINLTVEYKGLIKTAYVCSINNEVNLDFTKLNIDVNKYAHKLYKVVILDKEEFIIKSLVKDYKNIANLSVVITKKIGRLFSKDFDLEFDKKYSIENFITSKESTRKILQGVLSFYFNIDGNKSNIMFNATQGEVYYKEGFILDINGNLKYRAKNVMSFKTFMKHKAWNHKRFNTLIRRILFFKRIRPIKPDLDIINKCIKFEEDKKLLSMNFAKTLPWQIGRFFILVDIDNMFNGQREMFAGKKMKISLLDKTELGAMLYNLTDERRNPFVNKPKDSTLIIDNLRKSKIDNEFIDIASHYYIKNNILSKNENVIICDNDYLYDHLSNETNRCYLDGFNIFLRTCKMHSMKIPAISNSETLSKISKDFLGYAGVQYDFSKRMLTWARRYLYEYTYNFHLFNELSPKEAYVVGPYRQWLYHVANDFKIKSFEFQYAAIENGHLGYAYNKASNLKADSMIIWSKFWESEINKYNSYDYIYYPYEYFYRKIKQYDTSKDSYEYDMLFLSQNAIGDEMLNFAFNFAKSNPDIKILYRFHPHEEESLYSVAKECRKLSNFTFTDFHKEDVYKSLSVSKFVTGVYSTTTIEAFAMNKPIGLLNMPGIDYMKNFINEFEDISVLDSIHDLRSAYDNASLEVTDNKNAEKIFGTYV